MVYYKNVLLYKILYFSLICYRYIIKIVYYKYIVIGYKKIIIFILEMLEWV